MKQIIKVNSSIRWCRYLPKIVDIEIEVDIKAKRVSEPTSFGVHTTITPANAST